MFFWFIYIFSSLFISYILSTFFPTKFRTVVIFVALALLLTPENMGIGSHKLSPVTFSFIYELIFEQSISIRTLRPLVFSLPFSLGFSLVLLIIKRKLFRNLGL